MRDYFEGIVKRLSPTLKRITHKLNGHFSFFDEDDLLQEALIFLWASFGSGGLDDKTDSYILQGCYFHLKNYLRKTLDKTRLASLDKMIGDDDANLNSILGICDRVITDKVNAHLLENRIRSSGLTERESSILALLAEGLTVREVGKRLGISHVMVVKLKGRIRDKCKFLRNSGQASYHN